MVYDPKRGCTPEIRVPTPPITPEDEARREKLSPNLEGFMMVLRAGQSDSSSLQSNDDDADEARAFVAAWEVANGLPRRGLRIDTKTYDDLISRLTPIVARAREAEDSRREIDIVKAALWDEQRRADRLLGVEVDLRAKLARAEAERDELSEQRERWYQSYEEAVRTIQTIGGERDALQARVGRLTQALEEISMMGAPRQMRAIAFAALDAESKEGR